MSDSILHLGTRYMAGMLVTIHYDLIDGLFRIYEDGNGVPVGVGGDLELIESQLRTERGFPGG